MQMILCLLLVLFNQPATIGIMSAMPVELEFISEDMVVMRVDTVAATEYTVGSIHGLPCVTVHGGIGKVGAAQTAQILILKYEVEAIIFTGVAGGIDPELDIGDIVISGNVVHHDFGQVLPDRFVPFDTNGYDADSILVRLALQAAKNIEFEVIPGNIRGEAACPSIAVGRVATGDQFISSEEKRVWIERVLHADCVEMEGAAVGQVCASHKVPFVIIRSLSDLANEHAELDFETFVIYAAKNSSLLVKEMLRLLSKQ